MNHKVRIYMVSLSAVALLGILRILIPERPFEYTGIRVVFDHFFAFAFTTLLTLNAIVLGKKILSWLKVPLITRLEQYVFSAAAGYGLIAYGIFSLGVLHLLTVWAITLLLALLTLLTIPQWGEIITDLADLLQRIRKQIRSLGTIQRLSILIVIAIVLFSLLNALTPPWAYDSLMYHLQAPRVFLERNAIDVLPEFWETAIPLTIEMLFTTGLVYQSTVVAKLLHLIYGTLFVLSLLGIGRRILRKGEAWIATAIMVGIPAVPFVSSLDYSDMAWGLYAFLALYALILWTEKPAASFLILSGIMGGLAAGSKFTGLEWIIILGFLIIVVDIKTLRSLQKIKQLVVFGTTALLVCSPWYLKNWWYTGNPFFPLIFGGPAWDDFRLSFLTTYLNSYGVGRSFIDFVLLPVNIYLQTQHFTGFNIEIPSILFPLAFLFPLFRREKPLYVLGVASFLYVFTWFIGSQQARHLIPIYPVASLLATISLFEITKKYFPKTKQLIINGVIIGLLLTSLIYQIGLALEIGAFQVALGIESKEAFVERTVADYDSIKFIKDNLPPEARVLLLWDGQGYYCDDRCISDTDQSVWPRLVENQPEPQALTAQLQSMGVTHLLYSFGDGYWFMNYHDSTGRHKRAAEYFTNVFEPACTRVIFKGRSSTLYEISCKQQD